MADMEPFTNGESCFGDANLYINHNKMQEAVPSKFSTSQPIKELRSKPAPSESNTKEFNKLAIGEMPINENRKRKKPPYSPVFPYVARSDRKSKESSSQDCAPLSKEIKSSKVKIKDPQGVKAELIEPIIFLHPFVSNKPFLLKNQVEEMPGAFSSKAYHLLAKSGYDFFALSQLGKLNPELTGEKIYGLIEAQHELRRQGFRIDQPRTGLGFTLDEPVRMHMVKER
ncbi:UNVERIFIED_CONTAM: hypothetical protein Slati_1720500 [Sesamum latifolium]|uniref:Uncharacterized protein n=1 Tax=Sesamum latifolium TaxID=2727402 RepID=A0AAW2WX92_9LAMI